MDNQTANAIAELRGQLGELRAALGATDPDDASREVRRLRKIVEALVDWAETVNPPFTPPS